MKTALLYLKKNAILFLIIFSFFSCENELEKYPTINYLPCKDTNVTKNTNIINDFECQSNIKLTNVEAIRNPSEIQINKSLFVGKLVVSDANNKSIPIDLSKIADFKNNSIFKIKIKTEEKSKLIVRLEGGKTGAVDKEQEINADNGWSEYTFDFSKFSNEEHNKLTLIFDIQSNSAIYYLDDLKLETSKNICEGVSKDKSIVNDFECQKNVDIPEVVKVLTPNKNNVNQSVFSGKYTDETGAWDSIIIDYKEAIDLSVNNIFTIKVYAPVTGILKAKLEGGTSNPIEKDQQITTTGVWKEYKFNFLDQATENHNKIVLFFNAGVNTNGTDEYFIDDVRFTEDPCANAVPNPAIFNDFDCYNTIAPGGNVTYKIIENPLNNSNNSSKNVLEVTDDGTAPYDFLLFDFGSAIDLSTKNTLKFKIHSSKQIPFIAKLEGGTSPAKEISSTIDVVGDWKEYTFDFSSEAKANHNKIVLFFNAGNTSGTTTDIYYIDDIRFEESANSPLNCTGVTADNSIVNDAECQQNYTIEGTAPTQTIVNPDKSGINTSEFVLEVKDNGTDAWDHLLFNFKNPIDLSSKNILKIKILSSKKVPLLAKLEGGTSAAKEIWGAINTTGAWTEYTFDFSSEATENHTKLVLFFNGGQTDGSAQDIYYIDDVRWE